MLQSLTELVFCAERRSGERPVLVDDHQSWSAGELLSYIHHYCQVLEKLNVTNGERIAVQLTKSCQQVALYLAIWQCGAILVPLHMTLKPEQLQHIVDDCDPLLLFIEPTRVAAYKCALPLHVSEKLCCLDTKVIKNEADSTQLVQVKNQLEDVAAILYTSGSTGLAKGVILTQQNLLLGAQSVAEFLHLNQSDKVLAVLPFSFDYGLNQLLSSWYAGACVVLHDFLLVPALIKIATSNQITVIAAVPPLWQSLAAGNWPESSAQNLRIWTNSGGAMPTVLLHRLQKLFRNATPYLMYGLTEAFRASFLAPEKLGTKPGSVGQAIPFAVLNVVRPDGTECAVGEVGELIQRGPLVSAGYWRDEARTAERFKPDPFCHEPGENKPLAVWSGDLFYRDHEGDLYFVGRADDMLKCSGFRISPTEIENACYQADSRIRHAVAIAPKASETDYAILVLVCVDEEIELGQFMATLRQKLPSYAVPKAIVPLTEIPRTTSGKLDRSALKQQFRDYFFHGA